jgi:hypothetical protein
MTEINTGYYDTDKIFSGELPLSETNNMSVHAVSLIMQYYGHLELEILLKNRQNQRLVRVSGRIVLHGDKILHAFTIDNNNEITVQSFNLEYDYDVQSIRIKYEKTIHQTKDDGVTL